MYFCVFSVDYYNCFSSLSHSELWVRPACSSATPPMPFLESTSPLCEYLRLQSCVNCIDAWLKVYLSAVHYSSPLFFQSHSLLYSLNKDSLTEDSLSYSFSWYVTFSVTGFQNCPLTSWILILTILNFCFTIHCIFTWFKSGRKSVY